MNKKLYWANGDATEIPCEAPRYREAPKDRFELMFDYGYEADAVCRECGASVTVGADINDGALEIMTTGRAPGCYRENCGDKIPAQITAYRPVIYTIERADLHRLFRSALGEPIVCVHCHGDYLHHCAVDMHQREQEDGATQTRRLVAGSGLPKASQSIPLTDNPSSRRDGVSVVFWCEHCDGLTALQIAQHKGQSIIDIQPIKVRAQAIP